MPLHPEYEALLREMVERGGPALVDLPVEDARGMFRDMQIEALDLRVGAIRDVDAAGVPARVYQPAQQGARAAPVAMMFHGGGWVIGDLTTADSQCRELCKGAGAVVISVDYRLAPEHRFPAAAEDCYAATAWAAEHAARYGGDAARLAVVGDSAGGNLAAAVALMARDRGGPAIAFQLLVYPVTDGVHFDTPSYRDNGEGYLLTADAMRWFWDRYAPNEKDRRDPYASPLLAADHSGLPPALAMTAEFDPLRDEGEAYAKALAAAGVRTEYVCWKGLIHGFFGQTRVIAAARPPMEKACAALATALAARAP